MVALLSFLGFLGFLPHCSDGMFIVFAGSRLGCGGTFARRAPGALPFY